MKIIVSRKGFDSGYGGFPSAILPDGRMVSFPIPEMKSNTKYAELKLDKNLSYCDLMQNLFGNEIKLEKNGKVQLDQVGCHFDPDIDKQALPRKKNWRGILGQSGASQSHLVNQKIEVGDIFLFFGWFRKVDRVNGCYRYSQSDKHGRHIFHGYLEIGEILRLNSQDPHPWMQNHPHITRRLSANANDTLYIATSCFSADNSLKGYGTFKFNDALVLTKDGLSRSKWNLPSFFKKSSISYHSEKSWKEGYFQSAAKGQEFVVNCTPKIRQWAIDLIIHSICL